MIDEMSPADQVQVERARASRGRRSARAAGDERERAILSTAERLLGERSLAEISVDDLAQGAGISRSAFYFYFPSKDAVVLTLVDRVVEQAGAARDRALERQASDPAGVWREGIESFYEVFGEHRPVIRAVTDLGASNPEARALWSTAIDGWVSNVTELIEAERTRGAAPEGIAARDLATALVQMNERVLQAIFIEETPAVREREAIATLTHVWRSAIYGAASQR
jgi:TetR/AcrR family transcriptional regulator, ethionamide resistance regulator